MEEKMKIEILCVTVRLSLASNKEQASWTTKITLMRTSKLMINHDKMQKINHDKMQKPEM